MSGKDDPSGLGPPAGSLGGNPFEALKGRYAPGERPAEPARPAARDARPAPERRGRVVVRREKKGRAGKTVTRVQGLARAELEGLARDIKRALGCGATVEEGDVVLQGEQTRRAADWLRARGFGEVTLGN